jgi:Tfp pilus assembly protein PilN
MINLLPDDAKQQICAARTNIALIRYIIFLGFAVAFLVLIYSATYLLLVNIKANNEKLAETSQSKTTSSSSVKNQANILRTNLSTAKSILDQQLIYSDVIMGIAAALPPGIILETLSLNDSTFGTPIILTAHARSADDVPKIEENFQKSQLFSNYKLQSTTPDPDDSSGYPITVSMSIMVNRGTTQ